MAKITQTSETGFAVGWGEHPKLHGLKWETRLQVVSERVAAACELSGVTHIEDVIPAGCNNGVAGKFRLARHNGIKFAFFPIFEAMKNLDSRWQ